MQCFSRGDGTAYGVENSAENWEEYYRLQQEGCQVVDGHLMAEHGACKRRGQGVVERVTHRPLTLSLTEEHNSLAHFPAEWQAGSSGKPPPDNAQSEQKLQRHLPNAWVPGIGHITK